MRPTSFQSNEWKVFLEGVEIPFIRISVQSGESGMSGTVEVQSSVILMSLSPYAAISIFFRDRVNRKISDDISEDQLTGNEYILFSEGVVSEISSSKSADQRTVTLSFRSCLDPLLKHLKGATSQISDDVIKDVASETRIPIRSAEAGQRTAISDYLELLFPADADGEDLGLGNLPHRTDTTLGVLIHSLLAFFVSSNAACRNDANRTRLLNKFAVMNDLTLDVLISMDALKKLARISEESVDESASFLSIFTGFLSRFGYSMYAITCPSVSNGQGQSAVAEKISEKKFKGIELPASSIHPSLVRNDFLILPETYFLPPPPCNLIFPDSVTSISFSRNFDSEPTRSMMRLVNTSEGNVTLIFQGYKSTDGLISSISSFMGSILSDSLTRPKPEKRIDSDFALWLLDNQNALVSLSDDELTRGVILKYEEAGPEFYYGSARVYSTDSGGDLLYTLLRTGEAAVAGVAGRQDLYTLFLDTRKQLGLETPQEQVLNFNQRYLKFRHTMNVFNRRVSVVCRGLRWTVPGFSCVIFDKDMSFIGKITKIEMEVSAGGDERSVLELEQVRELAPLDFTTSDTGAFVRRQVEELDYYSIPAPPPHAEFSSVSPDKLDEMYSSLLGCSNFYTSSAYGNNMVVTPARTSKQAISNYLQILRVLARTFDGARRYAPSDDNPETSSGTWEQQVAAGADVGAWVEKTFHRRRGQTLNEYLKANGFKSELSFIPTGTGSRFLRMNPIKDKESSEKRFSFDDSILCRLVDGRKIVGLSKDELVETRRAVAIQSDFKEIITKQLTSDYRQSLVYQYSLRSFGNMSIKG